MTDKQPEAMATGAAYAALPEPITYQIAVLKACEHGDALVGWRVEPSRQSFDASMRPKRKLYTEGDMHDFADRTHAMRASHGQAPAQAAPAAVAGPSEFPHEQMDAVALARYKVVPSHESMFHRHAVVAGDGSRQLYIGREVECQNMAHKFAGAFLDGAFAFHSMLAAAPTTQPAPQQEARPVTPYTCPKCHALWLHWPAEQSGFGMDTLNCRSTTHCDYCEKGGVEQLERLERVPAALKAPQQEAQEPVGYTHASWIAEAKRGGGGSFVGRKNAAFDVPIYTAPPHSPAAQGDALDAERYRWLTADHHKQEDRIRVYEIATSMNVRGKGHIDAAIDAARAAQEGK
jgi:ssDNA-binding Zn-finger/Zn-ribbon topoisomerase 1